MTARRALALFCFLALGVVAYRWIASLTVDPRPSVLGLRLGMTADDVRARIDAHESGQWSSSIVAGDWVLEHRTADEDARFEIHEGQLVAIRVEGPEGGDLPSTPRVEVTPGSVLVREPDRGRVTITLLSRACPTHHEEAEALVRAYVTAP